MFQAAGFTFLAGLYIMLLIKDTRGPYSDNSQRQSYDILGAFSFWNVIDVFKTFFKRRENNVRMILMLLVLAMLFNRSTISK